MNDLRCSIDFLIRIRDGQVCRYCKRETGMKGDLDHIIPRSRGGKSHPLNLLNSCIWCNRSKNASMPTKEKIKILKKESRQMAKDRKDWGDRFMTSIQLVNELKKNGVIRSLSWVKIQIMIGRIKTEKIHTARVIHKDGINNLIRSEKIKNEFKKCRSKMK